MVVEDSSHDHEAPTMTIHGVSTWCHKVSSDHQAATICSIRANHNMTHNHVHAHDFIVNSQEPADNEVQLPACCCRAPSASAEQRLVRESQHNSDTRKGDTGFQVPPDCFAGGFRLCREWDKQDTEAIARDDALAGSQLTRHAMLWKSGFSKMRAN